MKKILSLLIVMALVSGVVFAQDESPLKPTVTADASLTWGIDLGQGDLSKKNIAHGFKNAITMTVILPLYRGTLSSKSEGDVHAELDIGMDLAYRSRNALSNSYSPFEDSDSEAQFSLWRNTLHTMKASLFFYGCYLTIFNKPDFSTNFAQIWKPMNIQKNNNDRHVLSTDIKGFGGKIGYKAENLADSGIDLDVGLKFASNDSWNPAERTMFKKVTIAVGTNVTGRKLYTLVHEFDENTGKFVKSEFKEAKFANPASVAAGEAGEYLEKTIVKRNGVYALGLDTELKYDKWVYANIGLNVTLGDVKDFYKSGTLHTADEEEKSPNGVFLGAGFKIGTKAIDGLDTYIAMDMGRSIGVPSPFAFDLMLGTKYKWVDAGLYYGNVSSNYTSTKKKVKEVAGVEVAVDDGQMGDMAVKLAFSSKETGDTNFVEGLAFGADLRFNRLLSTVVNGRLKPVKVAAKKTKETIPFGFKAWVSYKYNIDDAMWIKPYFNLWGETNHNKDLAATTREHYFGTAYELGLIYSPIEKVEVEAKWAHGKKGFDKYEGAKGGAMIASPVNHKNHNGTFTLGLKIKY